MFGVQGFEGLGSRVQLRLVTVLWCFDTCILGLLPFESGALCEPIRA